jgi:hypothetical protein
MTRPFDPRPKIRTDYLAAFAVTLAPLVYFFQALRLGLVLSPDDGVAFNVPLRVTAANLMRAGYLPLWNPYIFSGMPLHGASQAGLLFPLNWFYLAFSPPVATNLMMFLTYALAGLGAYLYARRAGADIAGAIATSLIWQWSAILVEHIGHTNILQTAALLPWVLWAIDVYAATGARRRGVILAALLALQMFAGHQQTFVYSLMLVTAYAIVMAITDIRLRRRYLSSLAFIAAGVFLAAVQILPTFELLRNSLRATATYEFFGLFSMPPYFVLTFLAPYVLGGGNGFLFRAPYTGPQFFGEYVAYVGVLTIMLAFVALILKRDARTKFWSVVFVVALLLAFGRFLPLGIFQLVYYVPVLNLFRSQARHLMEVEFALAVLAGRGLTVLNSRPSRGAWRNTAVAGIVGGAVFLLTCLTVTWWRPASFQLARQAPVSILRAPELFVPILIAGLSAVALWVFARSGRRRAVVLILAVLIIDLILYGQGSGWRTHSPGRDSESWSQTASVKFLKDRKAQDQGSAYRILTQDQPFDPDFPVAAASPGSEGRLSLQPDMYMTHGIENAAGYDGFGLARYSRLAGDMKVWGELPYPDRTLLGDSREIDLLNVRYLLTRSGAVTRSAATTDSTAGAFPQATQVYSGHHFGTEELQLPGVTAGQRVSFNVPPTEVDRIALITNMSWSENVPDRAVVAHLRITSQDGRTFDFELRAGEHTSEWAYDRPDITSRIKHQRAPVATNHEVQDAREKYQAHTYVCSFTLPQKTMVTSGSITVVPINGAPELSLSLTRMALAEGARAFPLTREMVKKERPTASSGSGGQTGASQRTSHWKRVAELSDVAIFENTRALPRAWLAREAQVLTDPEILEVIRQGKLSDGRPWEPERVALVDSPIDLKSNATNDAGSAEVTRHEPNRITVKARSGSPAILVLSENHYPGWRAYVDGRAVDTLRVNYNLRGVTLPAGDHTVEFIYRPKSVLIGAGISILTLIGLLLWWRRLLPEQQFHRIVSSFMKQKRLEPAAGIQPEV